MAVKEGYKQTEVGVIPGGWVAIKLGDCIVSAKLGGNYSNSESFTQYPLIKMGNLGRGSINLEKIEYITGVTPSELDKLNYADLLFNTRNTLELVGKVAIWRNELKDAYYNSNLMRIIFQKEVIATNFFVNYMLNSDLMIRKLSEIAIGTTSVAAIYNRDLFNICLPLPPLQEQKAIATSLSDIDSLINSLTNLIRKKKNIKQGAMQELLTGKKRLDGFSREWVETKLCKICNITKGHQLNKNLLKGKGRYYALNGGIIPSGYTDNWNREANTISISEGGESCGYVSYNKHRFWCGGHCYTLESISQIIDNKYLYQKLKLYQKDIMGLRVGSGLPNIQKNSLNYFSIVIPIIKEEQKAIATILSDMDTEIEKLQIKLYKYKAIKQGMMQELLTGRIRLLEGA